MEQEELKLHKSTVEIEEGAMREVASEYNDMVEKQRMNRLKFLLDKTTVYSNFLANKLEQQQKEKREKQERKVVKEAAAVTKEAARPKEAPSRSS